MGLQRVRAGCCGEDHTAAIGCRADDSTEDVLARPSVWLWGRSDYGSRGLAAQVVLPRPLVPRGAPSHGGAADVPLQLACGYHHSACVMASGHVLVWVAHAVRAEPALQLHAPAGASVFRRIACGGFSTAAIALPVSTMEAAATTAAPDGALPRPPACRVGPPSGAFGTPAGAAVSAAPWHGNAEPTDRRDATHEGFPLPPPNPPGRAWEEWGAAALPSRAAPNPLSDAGRALERREG
eukprot:4215241-Prymnesium_polylepis.1